MAIPPMAGFTVEHGLRDGAEVYEPQGGGDRFRQPPVARVGVEPGLPLVPVEKESTLDTVSSAFAALGLSYPLQAALLQAMGCGEDDAVDALVAAPQEEVNELIKNVVVGEEERAPTFFEKGALHSFFKKLRAALADPPSAPPASSTTPTPIVVTLPDTTNKLPLRDYLDQTITSCTFEKLSPPELKELRDRYFATTGSVPSGDARPTDEQVSALCHRIRRQADGTRDPPFTECAIWGPFNARSIKLRQFHAHVLSREGTWHNQLLKGPENISAWRGCWAVFEVAMIMLDAAMPGQLRMYKEGIEKLAQLFPNDWGTVSQIDETMRAEWWGRIHQEILDGTRPRLAGFLEEKPWGVIIMESRYGYLQGPMADWWREREIQLERALKGKPTAAAIGGSPLPSLPSFSAPAERQANGPKWGSAAQSQPQPGPTKGQKKRQKQQQRQNQQQPQPQQQQQWNWKGKGGGKGGKGNKGGRGAKTIPANYSGCHHCGSKSHFLADCPSWISAGKPPVKKARNGPSK